MPASGTMEGAAPPPSATAVPAPGSAAAPRLRSLDVLRAVAVTLVIGRHFEVDPARWPAPLAAAVGPWMRGGWVGVDLFFVLSGFLVAGLLFREYRERGSVRVGRFLARRGLKIYPGFYLLLAATVVERLLKDGRAGAPWPAVLSEALFVQNYGPRLLSHTWSLDVEEHFYLLCALLVLALARRGAGRADPFRAIPIVFVVVAVGCLAARFATAAARPVYDAWTHSFPTHLRIDGLMFGVCLAYLYNFHLPAVDAALRPRRAALLVLGALLLSPVFVVPLESTPAMYTVGYTVLYLGAGLLVLGVVLGDLRPTPLVRFVSFLGGCSYSIYLWHWMARWLAEKAAQRVLHRTGTPAQAVLYVGLSFVLGVAAAKLVELPVIRLRDRWIPSRTRAVESPSLAP